MSIRVFDRSYIGYTVSIVVPAAVLARRFTHIGFKGGLIFGACAELSRIVARYVVSFFSSNEAIARTAGSASRTLGGYYLGNMALQAAGFAPLVFTPTKILIALVAPFAISTAISILSKTFGTQPSVVQFTVQVVPPSASL